MKKGYYISFAYFQKKRLVTVLITGKENLLMRGGTVKEFNIGYWFDKTRIYIADEDIEGLATEKEILTFKNCWRGKNLKTAEVKEGE